MSQRPEDGRPPRTERNGDGAANNPLLEMLKELDQAERDRKPEAFAGIYSRGNIQQQRQLLVHLLQGDRQFSEKACKEYLKGKNVQRSLEERVALQGLMRGKNVTARAGMVFEQLLGGHLGGILVGNELLDIDELGRSLSVIDSSIPRGQYGRDSDLEELVKQLTGSELEGLRPVARELYEINMFLGVRGKFVVGTRDVFDSYANRAMERGAMFVNTEIIEEIRVLKKFNYSGGEAAEQFTRGAGYQETGADLALNAEDFVALLNLKFWERFRGPDGRVVVKERRIADLFGDVVEAMKAGVLPSGLSESEISRIMDMDSLLAVFGVNPRVSFAGKVVKELVIMTGELPSGYKKDDWRERLYNDMTKNVGLLIQTVTPSEGRFGGARGIDRFTFRNRWPSKCKDGVRLSDGRELPVEAKFGGSYFETMVGVDAVTFARLSREDQEGLVGQLGVKGLASYFYHLRKLKELSIELGKIVRDPNVKLLEALKDLRRREMSFIDKADQPALIAEILRIAEDEVMESLRRLPSELIPASFCTMEGLGLGDRVRNYFGFLADIKAPIESMTNGEFARVLTLELAGIDAEKLKKYNIQVGKRGASGAVEVYDFPALWALFQNTRFLRNRPYEEVLKAWLAYANLRVVEVDIDPRDPTRGKKKVLDVVSGQSIVPEGMDSSTYFEYRRIFEQFINRRTGMVVGSDISVFEEYHDVESGEVDYRMKPVWRLDQLDRLVMRTIQDLVHQGEEGFKGATWEADVRRVNSKVIFPYLHNYLPFGLSLIPRGLNKLTFRVLERLSPRAYQWVEEFSLLSIPVLIGGSGVNFARFLRMERWGGWSELAIKKAVDWVRMDRWASPVAGVIKDQLAPLVKKVMEHATGAVIWTLGNLGDWISIRNIPDVLTRNGWARKHPGWHSLLTAGINFLDSPWFVPPVMAGPRIDPIAFYNQVFQIYAERGIGCGVYGEDSGSIAKREGIRRMLLDNFRGDLVKVQEVARGVYKEISRDHPDYDEGLPDALRSRFDDRSGLVLLDDLVKRPDLVSMADFTPRAAMTVGRLQVDYPEESLRPVLPFFDAQLITGLVLAMNSFPRVMRIAERMLKAEDPRRFERMTPSERREKLANIILYNGLYQYAADPYDMRLVLHSLYSNNMLSQAEVSEFMAAFGCVGERRGNSVITGMPYFEGQVAQAGAAAEAAGFPDTEVHDPQAHQKLESEKKRGNVEVLSEAVGTFAFIRVPFIGRLIPVVVDVFKRATVTVPAWSFFSAPGAILYGHMPTPLTGLIALLASGAAAWYMVDRGDSKASFWRAYRLFMLEQAMRNAGAFFGSNKGVNELIQGNRSLMALHSGISEAVGVMKKGGMK